MKLTTEVTGSFALGQIIQQSRMQQELSQRDIARTLGISQKWVWEMEQGKPGILMDRLFKMLDAVGITLYAEFDVKDWDKTDETAEMDEA
ncbi:MAG: helix-turn-helix domain-containing protein [Coriobacteriales bacterium]|jgi:transcriptional regulator with XRE-family HTH domain|nr:helix-turn-helix domain-containing protein [Coriobacteriales bacterium]